jgi:DnaK suppressor protein
MRLGYNTPPPGLKETRPAIVAVKTKSAKKPAAKPVKKVAKPAAKPAAKAKPAARAKPAPKPAPKAKTPAAKAKPVASKAKPVAKAKPAASKTAAKPVSTVKRIASAIAKIVKPAPAAKPAPKPVAAKPLPERKEDKKTAGNATMPNPTPRPAAAAPAKAVAPPPPVRDGGVRAKAVKPNRPLTPNEPPVQPLPERVDLPPGYKPGPGEEYMSAYHLEYFRQKLLNWRSELVEESKQTIDNLRDEVRDVGDDAERATRETENSLELRTRDRYRKLISKIDKALKRIEDGAYGYCEETGEEIGIERLEARPIATLCLDAQERWEHRQKLMGD